MAEVGTAPQPQTHTSHSWMAVRNVLSNWGAYGLSIVITFFLSPFVVHRLGDAAYGVWVLIASLTGYLGLLDMGVRAAVTRYIPNFHTQGEHEESSRIVSSALALFAAAGLIAILLCCSVAFFALQYLHIPMHLWNGARIVLVLAGVSVALSLISGVFGGVVIGLQRFDLYNGVGTAAFVLRSVAIVLVLLHGYGLVALAVVQLSYALVSLAVNMLTSIRLYPELRPALSLATRTHLKTIFSFSVYAFALNVFSYVILYTDSLVIAAMLPVSLVTFFSIAANLVSYARQLVGGITTTVGPLASRLEASGDSKNLQEVTLTTSRYAGTLVMTIFFYILDEGRHIYRFVDGEVIRRIVGENSGDPRVRLCHFRPGCRCLGRDVWHWEAQSFGSGLSRRIPYKPGIEHPARPCDRRDWDRVGNHDPQRNGLPAFLALVRAAHTPHTDAQLCGEYLGAAGDRVYPFCNLHVWFHAVDHAV